MSELPSGWSKKTISDVVTKPKQNKPEDDEIIKYVDIGSINREKKFIENPQSLVGSEAPSRARKRINKDDVLVSLTRPNLNAVAIVPAELDGQYASTGFDVLKPVGIHPRFLFYLVRTRTFIDAISGKVQGALYPAAKSSDVQSFEFFAPEEDEQKRIADKLDNVLAKVEAAQARLDKIPAILKRFRQSVLAAATSGALLKLSKTNRCKLSEVCDFQNGYAFKSGWFNSSGKYQVVKLGNIRDGKILLENAPAFVSEEIAREFNKFSPKPGDILISMTGTRFKRDYGFSCLVRDEKDLLVNQRVGRITPKPEYVNSKYLNLIIRTEKFRDEFFKGETGGVNQGNVGSKHIMDIEIEVPKLQEQIKIVQFVSELLEKAEYIEMQFYTAKSKLDKLTQSILAKAFKGELLSSSADSDIESIESSVEALNA